MKLSSKRSLMVLLVIVSLVGSALRISHVQAVTPPPFYEMSISLPNGWTSGDLSYMWGLSSADIYAVGNGNNGSKTAGLVYHYDGDSWTSIVPNIPAGWSSVYLNG